jgi:NitT/TauT family transport system substrate-binding protein
LPLAAALLPRTVFAQGTRPALEKSDVSIAVGGKSAMIYLPLTLAERLGYFKAEGLNVTIADFQGGSKALEAVVGGSADVVCGVYEHTIRMISKNQKLVAFVEIAQSMQLALAVSATRQPAILSPKDLKGTRIGVSAPGSTTHMMVDRILDANGLKPRDVSIIGVGLGPGAVAAMQSGQIDAICTAEATASLMERKGLVKILVDARTTEGTAQVFGGTIPTSVLYAPFAYIQKNPNTIQALTNAMVRADQWARRAAPEELAKAVPEGYLAGDEASYLQAFVKVRDGYSPDGRFPANSGDTMVRALAAFDPTIDARTDKIADTFTNQFADRVRVGK